MSDLQQRGGSRKRKDSTTPSPSAQRVRMGTATSKDDSKGSSRTEEDDRATYPSFDEKACDRKERSEKEIDELIEKLEKADLSIKMTPRRPFMTAKDVRIQIMKQREETRKLLEQQYQAADGQKDYPYRSQIAKLRDLHERRGTGSGGTMLTSRIDAILNNKGATDEGHRRFERTIARVYEVAAKNDLSLEPVQQEFIDAYLLACAPFIYGSDWEANKHRVMVRFGVTYINQRVLCLAPRQFGKTTAVATFVTAMLLENKLQMAIFATGKAAATRMRDVVHAFITKTVGVERFGVQSKSEITVIPLHLLRDGMSSTEKKNCPDASSLLSLPASVNSE